MNDRFLRDSLNSSVLTHWHMILYLNILSYNEKIAEEAFISATKTIRIGFVGSTILVPLLVYSLKSGLVSSLLNMKPEEKKDKITCLIDKKIGSVIKTQADEITNAPRQLSVVNNSNQNKYMKDKNGDLSHPVIGFLSMGPLFQHKIVVPESFINFVKQKCSSSPDHFNQKANDAIG